MGPKQTTPQGDNPAGKKEGQDGATPVFSFTGPSATSSSPLAGPSVTSPNEPGALGSDTLSTGANVSRTMDSLNNRDQATHGGLVFAKHRFDKIDPKTGDILLTPDEEPKKKGFFATLFGGGRRKQAPESVSMVENRHKDVVIPEQYQNPGGKKRSKAVAQPAPAPATPADPVAPATPAASTQPAAPAQSMPAPAQPALASSTQPAPQAAPASQPAAPKKSRKGVIIALAGVAVVAVAIVAVVLVTNVMNSGNNKGGNKGGSGTSSNIAVNAVINDISARRMIEEKIDLAEWLALNYEDMKDNPYLRMYNFINADNGFKEALDGLNVLAKNLLISKDEASVELGQIIKERVESYLELASVLNVVSGYAFVGTEDYESQMQELLNNQSRYSEQLLLAQEILTPLPKIMDQYHNDNCSNNSSSPACLDALSQAERFNEVVEDEDFFLSIINLSNTGLENISQEDYLVNIIEEYLGES